MKTFAVLLVIAIAVGVGVGTASGGSGSVHARAAAGQQCRQPYPAKRDPANPLDLATPPGPNPLTGARFYVPGPRKGSAARTIAQLVGLNPDNIPVDKSWSSFASSLLTGSLHNKLVADRGVARNVSLLSKIAAQPEAQRFSSSSMGGSPSGIFKQVEKVLCSNLTADPGSIPIINTYFLHATLGGCPTPAQAKAYTPLFRRRIDAMARATDKRPAVFLLEVDAIGSSRCIAKAGSLPTWEGDLAYEIDKISALPHTVTYVEAGYSDSNSAGYTARVLNAIGVRKIRGFFTNDTHENWTIDEVRWATKVSKRTHGAHFIVNTADNGTGPKLNHNRVKNGNEELCNPPGRGLGIPTTTVTGYRLADAFMWTHPPGNSSGKCNGGPPGGVFWPARAEGEALRANMRLGPRFPSRPY